MFSIFIAGLLLINSDFPKLCLAGNSSQETPVNLTVTSELSPFYSHFETIFEKLSHFGHEATKEISHVFSEAFGSLEICNKCMDYIGRAQKLTYSPTVIKDLVPLLQFACTHYFNQTVCQGIISRFSDPFLQSLAVRIFKPDVLCAELYLCSHSFQSQTLQSYANRILSNYTQSNPPIPSNNSKFRILHLTDVHIDLDYTEGSNANCNEPLCCRSENGLSINSSTSAKYWGTLAVCDIPVRTLDQFVENVKKLKIDMIIWTGDNIAHDIWEQSQSTQTDSTFIITKKLQEAFKDIPVYPQFGNHECYPADQCDIIDGNITWLTKELAEMWKPWLSEKALSMFREKSYYSEYNAKHNLKVIVLNTQACDTPNFYLWKDPTDPLGELEWLENELADAENNGKNVFIIGHIPPGDCTCDSLWGARYNILVERYSGIVRGQFFGHTHNDQIQLQRGFFNESKVVGSMFIAPSLTTYSGLLPSFRIFEADEGTGILMNYYQYRLNLTKWNDNVEGPIEWEVGYDFLKEYSISDMTLGSLERMVQGLKSEERTVMKYGYNFFSGAQNVLSVSEKEKKLYFCNSNFGVFSKALSCAGVDGIGEWFDFLQQRFPGEWYSVKE